MKLLEGEFAIGEIDKVVAAVSAALQSTPVMLLNGEVGAGKTTFVKALAEHLGSSSVANSPTFSLINEYELPDGKLVFHLDLYRLKNETEAFDIGLDEIIDSGNICLIEWPEMAASLLPNHYLVLNIEHRNATRFYQLLSQ